VVYDSAEGQAGEKKKKDSAVALFCLQRRARIFFYDSVAYHCCHLLQLIAIRFAYASKGGLLAVCRLFSLQLTAIGFAYASGLSCMSRSSSAKRQHSGSPAADG
jgi:hypothetical protein